MDVAAACCLLRICSANCFQGSCRRPFLASFSCFVPQPTRAHLLYTGAAWKHRRVISRRNPQQMDMGAAGQILQPLYFRWTVLSFCMFLNVPVEESPPSAAYCPLPSLADRIMALKDIHILREDEMAD